MGRKIEWNKNLYFGEYARDHKRAYIAAIKKRVKAPLLYVIAYSLEEGRRARLEIIHNIAFLLPQYDHYKIVGLAEGRQEAFLLVKKMLEDSIEKMGKEDILAYLQGRE